MDDLYDDLENYNDTNVIEELRNENQELKAQVKNCTATIEKLQKDFDTLEAEYKKLELNYSSLLKTARAEVERKTQIITNLNIEKDMMVLNAIQNKNVLNIRRNWSKGQANNNQPRASNLDSSNKKPAANQPNIQSSSSGRKEASQTPSDDTTTSAITDNPNKLNIKIEKSAGRASDTKENAGERAQNVRPARAGSIRSRRKSMPATRLDKFSSDEEGEISSLRNPIANEPVYRGNNARANRDRNYNRQDRLDYNPYSRIKNNDNDKFRSRDRFEAQRNRFSPERFHRRSKKDFLDRRSHKLHRDSSGGYRSDKDGEQRSYRDSSGDHKQYRDRSGDCRPHRDGSGDQKSRREDSGDRYQRPEHRKRRLESPPQDKFNQFQQKNHEQFEKDYYDERNKYLENPIRVQYLSDYEEPSHKRMRTESHHSTEQDSRGHRVHGPELASQAVVASLQIRDDMSCQSPDYLGTELTTVPKEIKYDSEVKLDDPRENSDKYNIRIENGEKVLSTVIGRNVDLKPLMYLARNLPKVDIPKALMIPPSQCSDMATNIYDNMDIDNLASDISSVESGETMASIYDIAIDSPQNRSKNHHKKDIQQTEDAEDNKFGYQEHTIETHVVKNTEKQAMVTENNTQDLKASEEIDNFDECPRSSEKVANRSENVAQTQQSYDKDTVATEKITAITAKKDLQGSEKLNKSSEKNANDAHIQTEYVAITEKKGAEISRNYENVNKQTEKFESNSEGNTSSFGITKYTIPIKGDYSSGCEKKQLDDKCAKTGEANKLDYNELRHDQVAAVVAGKGMIEGDLELSDENSDNIELVKRISKELVQQSMPDIEKVIDKSRKKESTETIKQKSPNGDINEKNKTPKQKIERKSRCESSGSNNQSRSNKKTNKQIVEKDTKQAVQNEALNKEAKQNITESIISGDKKNKFSELFGDTSSLITPEDLGLTATEMRIESSSSNYFPIFEDAQDAIDVGAKVTGQANVATVSYEGPCIDKTKGNKNVGQDNFDKRTDGSEKETKCNKNVEKKVLNESLDAGKPKSRSIMRSLVDTEVEHSIKPIDTKETKSKSSKNTEKEKHKVKKIDANESRQSKHLEKQQRGDKKIEVTEAKSKHKSRKNTDREKQGNTYKPTTEQKMYPDKKMEVEESKKTSGKNIEIEHRNKVFDANETKITEEVELLNTQTICTETKRRKSRRNEEKSQLTIDTTEVPQPVITAENTTPAPTTDKIDRDDITPKEPDVVKTVIISSGVQPSAKQIRVNNFSPILSDPPVTPNIDIRQTRVEIPLLNHSVHIHALATSTPAKEIAVQNVQKDVSATLDVNNASDHTSQNSVNSQNDMDAPDLRIFVKRRKRVAKKTTPSKT